MGLGVGVKYGGRGRWCRLYLLHQFQLKFTGALVNELEVQQKTEEPLERVKQAFMECDTLLATTYGRLHIPSAASHTQQDCSVRSRLCFSFLKGKFSH